MLQKFIKKNSGFTLIELLVVITIIGILSGIVIVAVGDAVARANDSRRLADIRQLTFVLEREVALGRAVDLVGCTTAGVSTTLCTGPVETVVGRYFPAIFDPSRSATPCPTGTGTGASCQYSIHSDPGVGAATIRTNDYSICFRLEIGAGGLPAGLHSIRTGARITSTCP